MVSCLQQVVWASEMWRPRYNYKYISDGCNAQRAIIKMIRRQLFCNFRTRNDKSFSTPKKIMQVVRKNLSNSQVLYFYKRMKLFGGTVPPPKKLFGGTVPPPKNLFGGTT